MILGLYFRPCSSRFGPFLGPFRALFEAFRGLFFCGPRLAFHAPFHLEALLEELPRVRESALLAFQGAQLVAEHRFHPEIAFKGSLKAKRS